MRSATLKLNFFAIAVFAMTLPAHFARADYASDVLALNPKSYWRLNETTGPSLVDSGSNGFTLNYGASITIGNPGPRPSDGLLGFSATNNAPMQTANDGNVITDPVNAHVPYGPSNGTSTPFTVIAWVNPGSTSPTGDHNIVAWGDINSSKGAAFRYNAWSPNRMQFFTVDTNDYIESADYNPAGTLLPANTWSMLVGTYAGGFPGTDALFYYDNLQHGAVAWTAGSIPIDDGVGNDRITIFSDRSGASGGSFSGELIDEVAIFDYVLTPAQITALWNSAHTAAAAESVPEPSTFILAALGLVGLGLLAWRRRRR